MAEHATTKEPTKEQKLATVAYAAADKCLRDTIKRCEQNKADIAAIRARLSEQQLKLDDMRALLSETTNDLASKMEESTTLEDERLGDEAVMKVRKDVVNVLFMNTRPLESSTALAAGGGAKSPSSEQREAGTPSVQEEINRLEYDTVPSTPLRLIIKGGGVDHYYPSETFCTGTGRLSMNVFLRAKTKDLSDTVPEVFASAGSTLAEKMHAYIGPLLEELRKFDCFFLPIDRRKGPGFQDLPVYTYLLIRFLLENGIRLNIVDPRHKITDAFVRIINLPAIVDSLQEKPNIRIKYPFDSETDGLETVLYCNGNGEPDAAHVRKIYNATGLGTKDILQVRIVPGKKQSDFFGTTCYNDFYTNVATCLSQYRVLNDYVEGTGNISIRHMYIVLDPFSAYAAILAAAAIAYGVEKIVVLQWRQGRYIPMPVIF
jgi:hypothetical protein